MFAGNSSRKRKAVTTLESALKKAKVGVVTSRTKSLTTKVNKLLSKQELKYAERTPASAGMTVAGAITSLTSAIAQGDDTINREGRRLTLKYLHVHGYYQIPCAGTGSRVIYFIDKQANAYSAGALQGTDILAAATGTLADSFFNWNNRDRYKIIFDSYAGSFTSTMADSSGVLQTVFVDKYIPLKDTEVVYASSATAEALTNTVMQLIVGPVTCSVLLNTRLVWSDS